MSADSIDNYLKFCDYLISEVLYQDLANGNFDLLAACPFFRRGVSGVPTSLLVRAPIPSSSVASFELSEQKDENKKIFFLKFEKFFPNVKFVDEKRPGNISVKFDPAAKNDSPGADRPPPNGVGYKHRGNLVFSLKTPLDRLYLITKLTSLQQRMMLLTDWPDVKTVPQDEEISENELRQIQLVMKYLKGDTIRVQKIEMTCRFADKLDELSRLEVTQNGLYEKVLGRFKTEQLAGFAKPAYKRENQLEELVVRVSVYSNREKEVGPSEHDELRSFVESFVQVS